MKKNIIKNISTAVILTSGLVLTGCSSDFLDTVPSDRVSTEKVFTSANMANSVVNGAYERFYYEYIANEGKVGLDSYTEIMDLDANWTNGDMPIVMGNATAQSQAFGHWWKCFYEEIYRTSNVIQNIDKVPDMDEKIKARDKAECEFLRAWAYYRANCLWRGVPIYIEPVKYGEATKPRSSEEDVWQQIITDLTAAINESNLPDKYDTGNEDYGRVTKGAAYYLRGQVYLWQKQWAKAEADFKAITQMGYSLYPDYKKMFKAANEKNNEYIFQYQYTDDSGLGNCFAQCYGNRVTVDNAWNNFIPNPKFVDSYEWADGRPFSMDDVIPGYSEMSPENRSVYFLRDDLSPNASGTGLDNSNKKGYAQMQAYGSDMSKYLEKGNEARIRKVYDGRDPRMEMNFITPYSTYVGGCTANNYTYTLRWPYFGSDGAFPFDLRTDTNDRYYYLWRKFVIEGRESRTIWDSDIDIPIFRYAGALLSLAEALNEQGKTDEAAEYVNEVRARIPGLALLNSNEYTQVKGQEDMRQRIRNEFGWELCGEGQMYWKELRWGIWADKKFGTNRLTEPDAAKHNGANGMTEIWGTKRYTLNYNGDYVFKWAIPQEEIERNPALTQNEGWK
ncbi:RagB/SusD family nutrient uptake outer membrane protein [Phocaeicola oris]|uniref:RagB/SusD family nutrient uptake outer membrane protein n=1 Tax=Phocaeicola oris TaxID=2896850 RepID=UPI00234F86EF|nr:RagB/SusD family nutrient uptake outer membrane protein [Phocaeicola oris]MCE2617602.1 RagB/SusD family nutrient uptake outer membrane protein [Phocaeicola oris]